MFQKCLLKYTKISFILFFFSGSPSVFGQNQADSESAKSNNLQKNQSSSDSGKTTDSDSRDFADLNLEELLAAPVVESASKREQSIYEAPVSVSLITAAEIEASGAINIAEVFRRIPGAHVLQTGGNFYSLGVHDPEPDLPGGCHHTGFPGRQRKHLRLFVIHLNIQPHRRERQNL